MQLPVTPPIKPMLAKLSHSLPDGDDWIFEPKWDGFRTLVFFDGDELYLQSRDQKPLLRYFPELEAPLKEALVGPCALDGEVVIASDKGLDFELMLLRIHPAKSRVLKLAGEHPAAIVLWDALANAEQNLIDRPLSERREHLKKLVAPSRSVILTPTTTDRKVADDWFHRFEGAGLDGVIAKRPTDPYQPNKRTMIKVKHDRTADCVVAGFRWHKNGPGTMVGSLLLGLYDEDGKLHHVGIAASFTEKRRKELALEFESLREGALEGHPWADWHQAQTGQRMPGGKSRWNQGKDLSWQPLRLERVCEVSYDHLQGTRFRHATHLRRWRPDRSPDDCTYSQLDRVAPAELKALFRSSESDG